MRTEQIWRPLNRPDLGVANVVSETIRNAEWCQPDLLTTLRLGPTLLIASDYGGEHHAAKYESISFLLADLKYCRLWSELRSEMRRSIFPDNRRLSFKNLSDGVRARALVPFLRASNTIPGLLATFLIDRRIRTLFEGPLPNDSADAVTTDLFKWKPRTQEKLLRIAHLGAMLVAGLANAGQNLLWISDQDEIVANPARHFTATEVVGRILSSYVSMQMGHFRFGTTACDDGSLAIEDLAAIPDLAAGAMAEVVATDNSDGQISRGGILIPMGAGSSEKARAIAAWIADGGPHSLKRLSVLIDFVPPNELKAQLLVTEVEEHIPAYFLASRVLHEVPANVETAAAAKLAADFCA